ncbi:MAG: Ni/Fe-hydrogenase, b-type cytochrome subunit [Pseudomonadota bacterium]
MASITRPEEPDDLRDVADFAPGATPVYARQTAVYVYEAPVRLWHWINALLIVVLCVTGYLIGQPPPSLGGEASDHFLFGNIRFVHFAAGQCLAVFFLMRVFWAFFGNHHARQLFYIPIWRARWWREVLFEARWYSFLERDPKKYIGHNPLAQLAMFSVFLLPLIFMIITGFALYAEGAGQGHWSYWAFSWVLDLAGNPMWLHTLHRLGMWVIICFAIIHIYAAIREDIMSRQSMLSTMVSGWRMFKDDAH